MNERALQLFVRCCSAYWAGCGSDDSKTAAVRSRRRSRLRDRDAAGCDGAFAQNAVPESPESSLGFWSVPLDLDTETENQCSSSTSGESRRFSTPSIPSRLRSGKGIFALSGRPRSGAHRHDLIQAEYLVLDYSASVAATRPSGAQVDAVKALALATSGKR